jgi:hypothetical protein
LCTRELRGSLWRLRFACHSRWEISMFGKIAAAALAVLAVSTTVGAASAGTVYDGRWSLTINTSRGTCDTYNFPVEIVNGNVSFPGLVRAHGRVAKGGAVRVSVAAGSKSASGSGRLTTMNGSGRWTGKSGEDRCSGTWTAQKS